MKNNMSLLANKIESIIKNYLKIFGLKQAESLSISLGLITSIILIIMLLFLLIIFCSFVLSELLNEVFASTYLGYLTISAVYILIILFLIFRIKNTGKPAFTNLFIKLLLPLFKIETNQRNTLKGLKTEIEKTHHEIASEKEDLQLYLNLLQKSFIGDLKKELKGLIKAKVKLAKAKKRTAKSTIKKNIKKELQKWQMEIDNLKTQLNEASQEGKEQLQKLINELEKELEELKNKWTKIKNSDSPEWDIFKAGSASSFNKMKSNFENAKMLFK